jgi:hypothetical protein
MLSALVLELNAIADPDAVKNTEEKISINAAIADTQTKAIMALSALSLEDVVRTINIKMFSNSRITNKLKKSVQKNV